MKSVAGHLGHLQGPCSVSCGFTTSTAAGGATSNGRRVLRLEGGAAFGLGDHPTTQGAVEFLEKAMGGLRRGVWCTILDHTMTTTDDTIYKYQQVCSMTLLIYVSK